MCLTKINIMHGNLGIILLCILLYNYIIIKQYYSYIQYIQYIYNITLPGIKCGYHAFRACSWKFCRLLLHIETIDINKTKDKYKNEVEDSMKSFDGHVIINGNFNIISIVAETNNSKVIIESTIFILCYCEMHRIYLIITYNDSICALSDEQ